MYVVLFLFKFILIFWRFTFCITKEKNICNEPSNSIILKEKKQSRFVYIL